ncbi:oxidoreductase [Marinobacterium nitratireducens]|uniref:Oxidoreductase n=1 Tax=Marinobacterium nitratireducens TaxID=518897 RepID=A0A917ZSG2_9GAMM|nr:oxidoreductase [Marinobacterium nitratireducens]GGO89395.1 oxidoreductase [Marinobacterium nitratireducens]
MIRTAVIGYGLSARVFHLPFIRQTPELELVAISSRQPELRQDYPHLGLFRDGAALIDGSDAELVVITSPNDSHFALARRALEAGKHVLVEKPFVVSAAEGEALIELAASRQRALAVYHNRRFDGDFLTLQQLLQSGRLGEVRYFESHFDRFRPEPRARWREQAGVGSGILFDLGPHLIDQALALFGTPQAISARCRELREGAESTDFFHLMLHYPQHEVVLHSSPFCASPTLRFMVQGTQGSYCKYGLDPQEDALRAGHAPEGADWGLEPAVQYGQLHTADGCETVATRPGDYRQFYRALVRALEHGDPLPVSLEDALLGIRLIELALRSSREGRRLAVGENTL